MQLSLYDERGRFFSSTTPAVATASFVYFKKLITRNSHMTTNSTIRKAILVFLMSAPFAGAWFFRTEDRPQEREVCALTPMSTNAFIRLAGERVNRTSELDIFGRLAAEKKAELAGLDVKLQSEYGMDPSQVYSFDVTNRTINLVVSGEAVKGSEAPNSRHLPHRVFADDAVCGKFVNVLIAKRLTVRQLEVLGELAREKTVELSRVNNELKERFGIDPAGNYRFDAKTRKVYEIVPLGGPKARAKSVDKKQPGVQSQNTRQPQTKETVKADSGLPSAAEVRAPFDGQEKGASSASTAASTVQPQKQVRPEVKPTLIK